MNYQVAGLTLAPLYTGLQKRGAVPTYVLYFDSMCLNSGVDIDALSENKLGLGFTKQTVVVDM